MVRRSPRRGMLSAAAAFCEDAMIIDFHTHAFPEKVAAAAIQKLRAASHVKSFTDGTARQLQASMAMAGIGASLVLPVATHPRQVEKVNDASIRMNEAGPSTGVYSFGCMHPDHENPRAELTRIARAGLKGIKLHPIYQGVDFDDPRYLRILERCGELSLAVIIHAGFDVGYPGVERASPAIILRARQAVGQMTLILAHMGGWRCWDEAETLLPGRGLFIDTSFSLGRMTPCGDGYYRDPGALQLLDDEAFVRLVRAFGADHTLFGTDCPWADQAAALARFRALPLTDAERQAILEDNAARLLGIAL